MSSRSHPSVNPLDIEVPQLNEEAVENGGPPDDRVRMKDVQGMPGTPAGLALRLFQFCFAAVSVAVMASTSDFPSVTAFRYLVAALILQCLWSLSLAIVDIYALLVKRSLRNPRVVGFFTVGDGITSTLTFAAACASAGITVLIGNDFNSCAQNHCTRMETDETKLNFELKGKVVHIFSDFMARVTQFEELAAVGNRFLVSFQQGLEFIRRPGMDKTLELFEQFIKANETNRIQSYVKTGCVNSSNRVENLNKCK